LNGSASVIEYHNKYQREYNEHLEKKRYEHLGNENFLKPIDFNKKKQREVRSNYNSSGSRLDQYKNRAESVVEKYRREFQDKLIIQNK
jgi:hypothetical protein